MNIIILILTSYTLFTFCQFIKNNMNDKEKALLIHLTLFVISSVFIFQYYNSNEEFFAIFWLSIQLFSIIIIYKLLKLKNNNENLNTVLVSNSYLKNQLCTSCITTTKFEKINSKLDIDKLVDTLVEKKFIEKNINNVKIFEAIFNSNQIELKINWIDKSPTNKKEYNLRTLIFLLSGVFELNNHQSNLIFKELFMKYFNINRDTSEETFVKTFSKINNMKISDLDGRFFQISEILKNEIIFKS